MSLSESEAKEMATTIGEEHNLSADHITLLQLSFMSTDGITSNEAEAGLPHLSVDALGQVINDLSSKSLLRFLQSGSTLLFKGIPKKDVDKLMGLTSEEALVYQQIEDSGNEGIWTKHIKTKTNLHALVVTRCIKNLESRNLIKAVRSVKNPTRKVYMLWDKTPSEEVTGGPWYSEQNLDETFVKIIYENVFKFIARLSHPLQSVVATGVGACFSVSHESYPTVNQVHDYITRIQLSNIKLSTADITSILNLLVFDGKIVRLVGGKVSHPPRLHAKGEVEDQEDEDDDFIDEAIQYKAIVPTLEEADASEISPLMDIPCSGCVVSHLCYPSSALDQNFLDQFQQWTK